MKKKVRKVIVRVVGGLIGLCVIAIAALFLISGVFVTPKYMEPWSKSYAQKFDDPRVALAANGLLAASNHNMQP